MGKPKPKTKAKAKEPEQSPQSDAVPSSSGIFKNLFGEATDDQNAAFSIFSESNPYRRKPQESFGFAPAESLRIPNDVVSENPNLDGEPKKKRDRGKEKNPKPNLDSDTIAEASEAPLGEKKAKKEKPKKPNVGAESNGAFKDDKGRNPNLGSGSNGALKKDEGKGSKLGPKSNGENPILGAKKRKRDELEREYEEKKYGVAAEEEEEREKKKLVGEKRKTVDNVQDLVVSPEGYDDESKLLRTVFVGNLPLKLKKKALVKEFKQFGEVESVRIRSVPILDTKRPRKEAIITKQINETADSVHAYIVFKTEESTKASLSHNMAVVGGNHIRVDRACPPRKKLKGENDSLYDNKRTVFVGNLPYDVKDEELYRLFSSIDNVGSSIEAIRVIRHPHMHLGKGIAYILLKTREAANLVVKKRNLKLRDRELRVFHASRDSTPSKRSHPSSAQAANSPAKRLAVDPRTPESSKRANMKTPVSYQGLRASKSGVQKKVHQVKRKFVRQGGLNSKSQKGEKPKERQGKRPAVAARKAKELKDGGASGRPGIKRKLDSQTPDSFQRNKKVKKFK